MPDTARAMLLTAFNQPLVPRDLPVPDLEPGAILVRIAAAGICGSDLEITGHHDPRVGEDLLPLIPGHEGVGWVEKMAGERRDLLGKPVQPGDLIVWNRGVSCGHCYQCAARKRPALCAYREVYGINIPSRAPYWLNGCYADHIYVRPGSEVIILPPDTDPAPVAAASCSGATAAHALELSGVAPGDRVLVIGPGPLGLFCAVLALARGAAQVTVAGTARSRARLDIAAGMGCETLLSDDVPALGPTCDVVLDAAGNAHSVRQALGAVIPGGTVALPGVASPIGPVPVDIYEDLARKNVRLQGVWVSDASHLYQAISLVLAGRYNLDRLVTHRFPLSQANEALGVVQSREALKAVLIPE
jgi:2-desacetyl-2-hydroxyethyl bacteriochlorophyllide A dehydrogenase